MTVAAMMGALALGLAAGQDAPVQEPPPTSEEPRSTGEPADLGTVVVEGTLQQRVERFVEEVGAPPPGQRLARWEDLICVGVANMNSRYAQFMVDRVSQRAADLELTIGEPGCRPNVMIVATSDASGMAARLIDRNPNGFRPSTSGTDLGRDALDRFRTSSSPVRWWHVSLPVAVDTGEIAVTLKGELDRECVLTYYCGLITRVRDASRLRANVREDLARVLIILDVSQIGEIGFGALSDYVAMIALAQVDPAADMSSYPSILNLFAQRSANAALTDWDRDYLASLYAARKDRARGTQQAREIGDAMVDARRREDGSSSNND